MTLADKPWTQPISEEENGSFYATEFAAAAIDMSGENSSFAVVFNEDTMGRGDKELGKDLLKFYLAAMMAKRLFPKYLILLNSAVFLVSEEADTMETLKSIEEQGVSILVSEESVDFYELRGKVRVGILSSMEEILVVLHGVDKVISF